MAAYATAAQLRDRLSPQASQTDGQSPALLSDTELAEAIGRAQAEIDARLGHLYLVPFDSVLPTTALPQPVPALVLQIVLDLAALDATLTWRRANTVSPDDPARIRAMTSEALLTQLANGAAAMPDAAAAAPISESLGQASTVNPGWHSRDLTRRDGLLPVPLWSAGGYGSSWPYPFGNP